MNISKSHVITALLKALADTYKNSQVFAAEVNADQPTAIYFNARTRFISQEPFYFRIHYVDRRWQFYGHGNIPDHPEIESVKYFLQVIANAVAKL